MSVSAKAALVDRRGRGCRKIYGGRYFRCRKCQRLRYATQTENWAQRAVQRVDRIANLLQRHVERHHQSGVGFSTQSEAHALGDVSTAARPIRRAEQSLRHWRDEYGEPARRTVETSLACHAGESASMAV